MVQQIRRTSVFNFRILEFFALANKRDPCRGQRVIRSVLRYQKRGLWILDEILGVFCECADQENRPTIVNGVGDKRTVRMIGVLLGNGAQGSGCVPCCERPRLLSMGGALYARVVQKGRSLHFRAVGQGMALIFRLFFYRQFISSHISSRFSFV